MSKEEPEAGGARKSQEGKKITNSRGEGEGRMKDDERGKWRRMRDEGGKQEGVKDEEKLAPEEND